jgi:hypothetical protein
MPVSVLARIDAPHKQTGPRTAAGKERSSSNATLHGGTSKKLIVAGEIQADFDALLNGLLDEYQPDTFQSRLFVEELATAQWFLWRRHRAYNAIECAIYEQEADQAKWTEEHLKRLALADRYKTQAERALKRALTNLENWRKETRREAERELRNKQWGAGHSLRERRVQMAERQFALSQSLAAAKAFRLAKNAEPHAAAVATAGSPIERPASAQEAL